MKLTKEQMESVETTLIDETTDFILDRVCTLMYEVSDTAPHNLDLEQIDELVTRVFKGFYYEKAETEQ